MFSGCSNITAIDLSNFDTSKVIDMNMMFYGCSSLSSLNLSNYDTSKVIDMNMMFSGCSSLSSLNLSNFNTSNVNDMNNMFSGCSSLEYINLNNFIEKDDLNFSNIFNNVPNNVVVCLNENSNKIKKELQAINCYTIDCSDNWKINQKKLVNKADICFDNSNISILYNYEYQGLYYENCINGNLTNTKTINYCNCDNQICLSCPDEPLVENLCVKCNTNNNYYEIENDNNYTYKYKKCYNNPIGYYLDMNESIYKKCYFLVKIVKLKEIIHYIIVLNVIIIIQLN